MLRLIAVSVFLFLAGCGATAKPVATTSGSSSADLDFPVGHFSLMERGGRTFTEQDLRGSVWVASFVFTRCMGPCPQVTATVARLQEELRDVPNMKFVTFTVDPSHDDMTRLREYAKRFNAHPERWLFLTGDEKTIHQLIHDQFKQAVERKSGEDVKPGDEFGHSTRLVLVDKRGIIRAFYDGVANEDFPEGKSKFDENIKNLEERARQLAKEE